MSPYQNLLLKNVECEIEISKNQECRISKDQECKIPVPWTLKCIFPHWFLWNSKKCNFWHFELWFLAILGPVEYSTGLKSAKYHPEPIFMNLPPFQKKWGKFGRGCPWPTAKYVGICQIPKIAYFAKVLLLLFLLLFWVTPCCLSKNLKSELFLNIWLA